MVPETNDTIVALATAHGTAAIALIRLSGPAAIRVVDTFYHGAGLKKKSLVEQPSRMAGYGLMVYQNIIVDEVVVTVFRTPASFTGQDCVEVSCHGSIYIQQQLLQLFLSAGARMAQPGEFTMRAFMNGKMDLSQAEAVADLIASNSSVSHQVAMQHLRGGFSTKIKTLRQNLIDFASLLELELDFSEEDVEFASRSSLNNLIDTIISVIASLIQSFELGNVIKNGIPVAIVGKPNAGKSTLLNVLLEDERAIVSEIPGTTRDLIEDEIVIDGILFRFIDTAGLRTTSDIVEKIGVDKALEAMKRSAIIIYVFDSHSMSGGDLQMETELLQNYTAGSQLVIAANKTDTGDINELEKEFSAFKDVVFISAKEQKNIGMLKQKLVELFDERTVTMADTVVTNARHAEALRQAERSLYNASKGLNAGIAGDLLALDIRKAIDELGNITGQVTSEDLLQNIFSRFCIGK